MEDGKLAEHLNHSFYKKVDKITDEVRLMQIIKGAEKYPEPFTPSSWTGKELAIHALQELRDGQVYVVGLLERIEELESEIEKINQCINEIRKLLKYKMNSVTRVEIEFWLDKLEGKQ